MSGAAAGMRRIIKSLFDDGGVSALVGFAPGSDSPWSRPAVAHGAAAAARLSWDATCGNNLAAYLPALVQERARAVKAAAGPAVPPGRIAMVVKGCDMRAVTALLRERQAVREDLYLIGMPCRGMLDRRNLEAALRAAAGRESGAACTAAAIVDGDDEVRVKTADGAEHALKREPLLRGACRLCMFPVPDRVDVMVEGPSRAPASAADCDRPVREFAAQDAAERWRRFQEEMSRCIRCYACRQACPLCYCKECFAEANNPAWIGASADTEDVTVFHLGRILHQAGRCVECGACSGACPMGIDLSTYTGKIAADARELFGFTADFSPDTLPPLSVFKEDDPQEFIMDPEKGCGCGR